MNMTVATGRHEPLAADPHAPVTRSAHAVADSDDRAPAAPVPSAGGHPDAVSTRWHGPAAGGRNYPAQSANGEDLEEAPGPAIAITPWNPDTPCLKKLKATEPAQRFAAYMVQRKELGKSPAFFLDCADVFLFA